MEKARASPCGEAAEAVAVLETILTMWMRGLWGSSSWIDCQLYRTRSFLLEIMVVGVASCDERKEPSCVGGVDGTCCLGGEESMCESA